MKLLTLILLGCLFSLVYAAPASIGEDEKPMRGYVEGDKGITDWNKVAENQLQHQLFRHNNLKKAKNVIFFIGDGMGITTVTAARIYNAQLHKLIGEDASLEFEKFPHAAMCKTHNTDRQVAGSAGTSTAFHTGVKTKRGIIGLNQKVFRKDCAATADNKVRSVLKYCQDEGKWAGIVTTTRITHATPAGAYAHAADRNWESDAERNAAITDVNLRAKCPDIASQLIDDEDNSKIRVLLGGGRRSFYPNNITDPEYPTQKGKRQDGRNLIDEWVAQKLQRGTPQGKVKYVYNKAGFDDINPGNTDYLLGLFQPSHMNYEVDKGNPNLEKDGEPTLKEMVEKAIRFLRRSEKGFFLFVEGGHIDLAHHDTKSVKALNETVAMSDAVKVAMELTSDDNTLIIVSADHSHAFSINGYPYISNNITGLVRNPEEGKGEETMKVTLMEDGKSYTTLGYAQGPSYSYHRRKGGSNTGAEVPRKNLTDDQNIGSLDYMYDAPVPRSEENHGGEDVAIYASGPMAHLFDGVVEQNYIAHAMMYAACVGPNKEHCKGDKEEFEVNDEQMKPLRGYIHGDDGVANWNAIAQDILDDRLKNEPIVGKAKNVILFIGDGMGPATVTASRIYHAQSRQLDGDDAHLEFEKFPYVSLSRTYNTDRQVGDSAGTSTAFHTGVKTKRGIIGLNQKVFLKDCAATADNKVRSVLKYCQDEGKWAGIVTTTRITHATPAGAYAHAADHDWESDAERNAAITDVNLRAKCPDIASQLIDDEDNSKIRVLLGGGRRSFYPNNVTDPEYPTQKGKRQDGRNLIDEWIQKKITVGVNINKIKYVYNKTSFDIADPENTDYLLGLFQPSHMNYEADKSNSNLEKDVEPSLAQMVEKAILILQRSPLGFYLFVEGGHIDLAHHDTKTAKALNETAALSDAVAVARQLTSDKDTLIIVSADHSHSFTMSGYPYISNDVLGLAKAPDEGRGEDTIKLFMMDDNKPYLTLSYMNGPGYLYHRTHNMSAVGEWIPRRNLSDDVMIGSINYLYDAAMNRFEGNHGGEDVAVYASGPMAHLFEGTHEQNYIAHVMMFATCTGPYKQSCDYLSNSAAIFCPSVVFAILILILLHTF